MGRPGIIGFDSQIGPHASKQYTMTNLRSAEIGGVHQRNRGPIGFWVATQPGKLVRGRFIGTTWIGADMT